MISGLDCHNLELNWQGLGSKDFVNKHFKKHPVRVQDVKEKLEQMEPDNKGQRLRMAVLYLLSTVIFGHVKQGKDATPVLEIFQRVVSDLNLCMIFPWGRLSFDLMLESISHTMEHYNGNVTGNWTIPGFCVPLEVLAFEAISGLKLKFREEYSGADDTCPRMCRFKWKKSVMKGFPLDDIYEELKDTKDIDSLLIATAEEKSLLEKITEVDDDVDEHDVVVESWMKRIKEGYTVFFEDMLNEDLEGRKDVINVRVAARAPRGVGAIEGGSTSITELANVVKNMREQMGEQMKVLVEKVDGLVEKVEGLEKRVYGG